MKYLVYLGGPICGYTYGAVTEWREYVRDNINRDIGTLSPMRGKEILKGKGLLETDESFMNTEICSVKGINMRDKNDVRRADALLVNFLDAHKVSIGTVMEIAWADMLNIPIVVIMETGNIHEHIMLEYACGYRAHTLQDGIDLIEALLLPDKK